MEQDTAVDLNALDWHKHFGRTKDEKQLSIYLTKLQELSKGKKFEEKSFSDKSGTFKYNFDWKLGISIGFHNEKLHSVFLYNKYDKKFSLYPYSLPYNLNFEMTSAHIVSKLGEPNTKVGGNTVPITLTYERLGLEVTFISPVWEIADNKINFLSLFEAKKTEANIICAMCRKKSQSFCGKCRLVAYCSSACQTTHWKVHKPFCS